MGSNDLNKLITINHGNKERIRNSITENLTRTTKIRKIPFNNFMLMITSMNILCAYVDRKNSFISAKEIIFFCLTRCFWNTKRMRILNGTCPDLKKKRITILLDVINRFHSYNNTYHSIKMYGAFWWVPLSIFNDYNFQIYIYISDE